MWRLLFVVLSPFRAILSGTIRLEGSLDPKASPITDLAAKIYHQRN